MALESCIDVSFTVLLSFFGIAFSIVYLCYELFRPIHNNHFEDQSILTWLKGSFDEKQRKERIDVLIADYGVSNDRVANSQNATYLTGTILVAASFVILGSAATSSYSSISACSLASIGLFMTWLLLVQVTGKIQKRPVYTHLKAIERALSAHYGSYSFGTHKLEDESAPWVRFRRMLWGFVLLILSLSWLLLSIKARIWLF